MDGGPFRLCWPSKGDEQIVICIVTKPSPIWQGKNCKKCSSVALYPERTIGPVIRYHDVRCTTGHSAGKSAGIRARISISSLVEIRKVHM